MGGAAAGISVLGTLAGAGLRAKAQREYGDDAYIAGLINAQTVRLEAFAEERRRRQEGRRELSRERVAYAKAGLALEGSPLEVMAANAAELERDALHARLAGLRSEDVARREGKNIRRNSRKQALSSILTGVSFATRDAYTLM